MPFQLSPGVNVSEIDLTTIVPAVGTTEGAFVGKFNWGPVEEIRTVSSEVELVDTFGKPDSNNFTDFFTAANFLSYARNLKVVRAYGSTANNASRTGILIKNSDDYSTNFINMEAANTAGMFAAKYPGPLGNSLKVSIFANTVNRSEWTANTWQYSEQFDGSPGTSDYASAVGGSGDELHLIVIDKDGKFSGTANTVLEKFPFLSKASDAITSDGSSNYYVNVINDRSKYIYIINHALSDITNASDTVTWGLTAANQVFTQGNASYTSALTNGSIGSITDANIITSYDKFRNAEEVDVSLILTGDASANVVLHCIDNIAEFRKDCVVFCSPDRANGVSNSAVVASADKVVGYRNLSINRSTSYAVMDSSWKYQFDKYNNVYRWVPMNGDIAGLCVRTDFERDPWFSPAGFNRGQIKNVVKLSLNPDKTDRDELYKNGINPVVTFRGEGTVLYGDKTMLSRPSAFDRINVRRLFIVLEKAIARAAKYSLFEFNDEFTRAQFVALIEPYLRDVQGRRGIYDFRVVCDETNNTPEVIDRNEFVGDIYIKPARSINFIQLNFVAVRTGVAFEEVVGRF